MASATSRIIVEKTRTPNKVRVTEMKKFVGITIIIGYLKFPRIRTYWAIKTRVPRIADQMPQKRYFFEIRSSLRRREYNNVNQNERVQHKFQKIRPLLDDARNACLANPRSPAVAIDEHE